MQPSVKNSLSVRCPYIQAFRIIYTVPDFFLADAWFEIRLPSLIGWQDIRPEVSKHSLTGLT